MSEQEKHTPKPWIVSCGSVYRDGPLGADGFPAVCIAHMDRNEPKTSPCERDRNADLIAAAPELLDELRELEAAARIVSDITHAARIGKSDPILDNALGALYFRANSAKACVAKASGNH